MIQVTGCEQLRICHTFYLSKRASKKQNTNFITLRITAQYPRICERPCHHFNDFPWVSALHRPQQSWEVLRREVPGPVGSPPTTSRRGHKLQHMEWNPPARSTEAMTVMTALLDVLHLNFTYIYIYIYIGHDTSSKHLMSLSSSAKLSKDPSGFTSCSLWGGSSSPERSTALLQDAISPHRERVPGWKHIQAQW